VQLQKRIGERAAVRAGIDQRPVFDLRQIAERAISAAIAGIDERSQLLLEFSHENDRSDARDTASNARRMSAEMEIGTTGGSLERRWR
jgi:hypothetical protein